MDGEIALTFEATGTFTLTATGAGSEQVTAEVLAEIGAEELPRVLVFNKCDRIEPDMEATLRAERPDAWFTAAHDPLRVATLHTAIVDHFQGADPEFDLFVPWDRSAVMGRVRAEAHVVDERFEDDGVHYRLRAPALVESRLREAVRD